MVKKITENNRTNGFNPNLSIGIVGYGSLDALKEIQDFFRTLEGFTTVYIKTSNGKLWIKEGNKED